MYNSFCVEPAAQCRGLGIQYIAKEEEGTMLQGIQDKSSEIMDN
jgi:hypothetical protein